MPEDILFIKGVDVGRKGNRRMSEPTRISGVETHGDVLFIKGVDKIEKSPSSTSS